MRLSGQQPRDLAGALCYNILPQARLRAYSRAEPLPQFPPGSQRCVGTSFLCVLAGASSIPVCLPRSAERLLRSSAQRSAAALSGAAAAIAALRH